MKVSPEPGLAIRQWEHLDSKCRGKAPDGCSQADPEAEAGMNWQLVLEGSTETTGLEVRIFRRMVIYA